MKRCCKLSLKGLGFPLQAMGTTQSGQRGWDQAAPSTSPNLLTLAHANFCCTAVFWGSTWRANLRLLIVYSWPQNTFCGEPSMS